MSGLSLKARLSWLIALVLGAMLIGNIAILVVHAGPRVREEADNTERLAHELVTTELARLQGGKEPLASLQHLFESMRKLRHVQIQFLTGNNPYPVIVPRSSADRDPAIPDWFVWLVAPAPKVTLIPAIINGHRFGDIAIGSYPADEAAEVWSDAVSLAQTSLVATLIALACVLVLVRRSLTPLDALAQGLARLEDGRASVRLALKGAREFGLIAARLNSLAATLDRVRGENQALLEKLIKVQDDERRGIARDLHDEAGPCLFSIRAGASTLSEKMSDSKLDVGVARKAIGEIQSAGQALQDVVRRMLDQLRPPGLAELGLEAALRSLVANWQGARGDLKLTLETPHDLGCLDEAVALTAYRIVQESLTNIYRHASATWATVRLAFEQEPAHDDAKPMETAVHSLHIVIEDNGVGFSGEHGKGRGLVGMTERVKALDGEISVAERANGGTRIDVRLPALDEDESPT